MAQEPINKAVKCKVTIEFELPEGYVLPEHESLSHAVWYHTKHAAILWHLRQAATWACKEGETSPIFIVHNNWAEWLQNAEFTFAQTP